jgi:signal transduction histidine kinase
MQKRVDIVESEVGRLSRLLTEFLELARPRQIGREPVHVGRLVDDVVELERGAAEARNIRIVKEIPAEGAVAMGDAEKLKQVVLNVIVNAMEAMKEGGTLTARMNGMNGISLTDEKGGTSNVTTANVYQSNGVIHVVDTVLMPN